MRMFFSICMTSFVFIAHVTSATAFENRLEYNENRMEYNVVINSSDIIRNLNHFWRSTGFCPPLPHQNAYDFDFGNDMKQNLALIGAIAHGGIEQVRIHWLLDLVTVKEITNKNVTYDFSKLDDLIGLLWERGLKPGFEIMGNPSGIFSDFENITQVYMWKDLVQQVAQNYVDQFGLGDVSTWNFETWNEPDCKDFDKVKMTPKGFLNYYDASRAGLDAVSKILVLGGPGDGCDHPGHSQYSDAFLDHVVNGKNVITGENVSVDYISFHRKGGGSSKTILEKEIASFTNIVKKYPSLQKVKFFNDEADPLVGWSKDEWWRADATYAAIVAKIIAQHQNSFHEKSSINYALLSNDNGFLSFYPHQFTQRTLLARFQMNNTQKPYTEFVRKPVHAVMSMLALLGDKQLDVQITTHKLNKYGKLVSEDAEFGVLASYHDPEFTEGGDSKQVVVLAYNSADTSKRTRNDSVHFDISLDANFTKHDICIVQYALNNLIGNPYAVWTKYGNPDFPSQQMFKEMRLQEGPVMMNRKFFRSGSLSKDKILTYAPIPQPGILLTHVCAKSKTSPDQTTGVNFYNITIGQVLITWSDNCVNSKCVYRYDVEFSKSLSGPYVLLNKDVNSIVTAFVYAPQEQGRQIGGDSVIGYYRVRAVDYFERAGEYSLPQKYPQ
ncbi:hypothetical protein FSP39_002381 [Pinctada imbricata]|uniref:Alpha-L-iduronidase n=1 Tax=Pinctada imbricata TaxID=66713 RepID=A0AA89C3I3_PINIB|nr:hypothetical protein FSP39_002381 [Pinctada imbricata]